MIIFLKKSMLATRGIPPGVGVPSLGVSASNACALCGVCPASMALKYVSISFWLGVRATPPGCSAACAFCVRQSDAMKSSALGMRSIGVALASSSSPNDDRAWANG